MQTASAARRIKVFFTQRFPATDFLYNMCLHSPVCTTGSNNNNKSNNYTISGGLEASFSPSIVRVGKQYTNWDDMHILSIILNFITCNLQSYIQSGITIFWAVLIILILYYDLNCRWRDVDNKNISNNTHTECEHPHMVQSPACHVSKHDFHTTLSTKTATTMTTTLAQNSLPLFLVCCCCQLSSKECQAAGAVATL